MANGIPSGPPPDTGVHVPEVRLALADQFPILTGPHRAIRFNHSEDRSSARSIERRPDGWVAGDERLYSSNRSSASVNMCFTRRTGPGCRCTADSRLHRRSGVSGSPTYSPGPRDAPEDRRLRLSAPSEGPPPMATAANRRCSRWLPVCARTRRPWP